MPANRIGRVSSRILNFMLVSAACLTLPGLAAAQSSPPLAAVHVVESLVTFQPSIAYREVRVTVSGPKGFEVVESFAAGESPAIPLPGADGLYKYELRFSPMLERGERERGKDARTAGIDFRNDAATDRLTVQHGWFTLAAGGPVAGDLVEEAAGSIRASRGAAAPFVPSDPKLTLTNSDGVIRNSLCVGFDCPDSPAFGDSTILMMENNIRIKFGDTSNAANFPRNDWEIEANSSQNGGANYLGFNDCGTADNNGSCATDLVFAVEAGVRASALYVESDGDVGLGTSNPVVTLHIVDGNTPTLRLDQDGSAGFTPQVWDVAGNETNFFIRDATNGSKLPLRIRPDAPTNSIHVLGTTGNVGFGTASPDESIHVRRTDATATHMKVENANAATQITGVKLSNATTSWAFELSGVGNFQISEDGSGGAEFLIDENAVGNAQKFRFGDGGTILAEIQADGDINNLTGVYGTLSDRNLKTDIQSVDPTDVLARVANLPISTWRFKNHPDNVHLGPMAQDFWAAFGLYEGETSIALNDLSGVALAAIQGLNQEVRGLNREVEGLDQEIDGLNREIEVKNAALQQLLERVLALEAKVAGE